jgi:tetratricopeptide (TPR) repeat protein
MCSPRCTEQEKERRSGGRLVAASLLLAACAALSGCASTSGQTGVAADSARPVPAGVRTTYEQAVAVMAAGDLTEAELRFDAFLLEHPGYPGAHVNLAIVQAEQGDDAAAEASIQAALALDPSHPAALNQLGMLRRRQGRFEEAEAAYLKAVTADSGYALAHYNLGVLYELYLQRLEPALQHFETFQELGSGDEQVARWIVDLRRRVAASQRTASAME